MGLPARQPARLPLPARYGTLGPAARSGRSAATPPGADCRRGELPVGGLLARNAAGQPAHTGRSGNLIVALCCTFHFQTASPIGKPLARARWSLCTNHTCDRNANKVERG